MESLQYPIGRFVWTGKSTPDDRAGYVRTIAATPTALSAAVAGLSPEQLDVPYREGGWTSRQVVHHYADDHMNSYIRFKLALTEEAPVIKGYSESSWVFLGRVARRPFRPG